MNVQEWYKQMRASNVPLQFAAEQLAERDAKIEELRTTLKQTLTVKMELAASRETFQNRCVDLERQLDEANTVLARQSMKIVNQRGDIEYLRGLIGDERKAHLETKQKLEAAEKRGAAAMSRLIENWLSKEYMPKILGFDFAKDEPWITRAYTTGWGGIGKTAQAGSAQIRPLTRIERRAEARRCRDAGIKQLPGTYGEDDLHELEIFEQVKRETPQCEQGEECSSCNTIAAKRFEEWRLAREQITGEPAAENESMAENEARETESLAHRIEKLENGRRYDNECAVEKMLDAEKRLGMHDTQFRRTTERFDRHAKKLTELDGSVKKLQEGVTHARLSRGKMHAQIDALEKRTDQHRDIGNKLLTATLGESRMLPDISLVHQIADIRKTAEADRVEFRAADAAVHERISRIGDATFGEGADFPVKPLAKQIAELTLRILNLEHAR